MTAYRSIDGTGNNQNFNATATDMTRVGTAHFVDGISEPIETVNPRTVSNNVVGEGDANVANPDGLSAFMYAWGQFIDHDLDLGYHPMVSTTSMSRSRTVIRSFRMVHRFR